MTVIVKILPNDKGSPSGKLADAELHFTDGPLAGLKLLGFAVWERRSGPGRNVTFPSRTYSVNGERRSFSLLRPASSNTGANDGVRDLILGAYAEYEQQAATGEPLSTSAPARAGDTFHQTHTAQQALDAL